jgi:hypothetical protein
VTLERAIYILPVCLIFTNWEFVRKIRAPEQETAYTTYSKIMGPRAAILLALTIQGIFTATVFAIFNELNTPYLLRTFFGAAQIVMVFPSVLFLLTLRLKRPLKPFAEAQILLVVITLLAAALL